jgi:hypothetical protein
MVTHKRGLSLRRALELFDRANRVDSDKPPRTERAFLSILHELIYLCKKVHYWLHIRCDERQAKRYLPRLKRTLWKLSERDAGALAALEGLALFHLLNGNVRLSLKYRRREIRGLERLNSSIQGSIRAGRLSAGQASQILARHGPDRIRETKLIARALADSLRVKRKETR